LPKETALKNILPALLSVVAALSLLFLGAGGQVSAAGSLHATTTARPVQVCGSSGVGQARCTAIQMLNSRFHPDATGPAGFHPADLQSAYNLPSSSAGSGQTVAIVDAYDDPNAEADLQVYRSTFGLPPCSSSNGCFTKVNEQGKSGHYPKANQHWSLEISLDLDMVSAICPNCHILLVEATSQLDADLGTSVNTAARLGANVISNSYILIEFSGEASLQSEYYTHPGIMITASSGDAGYPNIGPPAVFSTVTAVGGTALNRAKNARGWQETAWSDAGSGCSKYDPKPSWQVDKQCSNRTVADVSAVADPATGVSVYDTYGSRGWIVLGGTSVGSPIIASVFALAGNESSINPAYPYSHTRNLYDVKKGNNGTCGNYLCQAKKGYDGPTGLGTPNGVGAF
jgi:subtilase family serine protease